MKTKKTIYTLLILVCLLSVKLYSQSEHKCFTSEKKAEGLQENTMVLLVRTGNNIEAEVKKDLIKAGNSYSCSWEMNGTIDGNKIIFNVPKGTVDHFNNDSNPIEGPKSVENWILRDGQLLINEQILSVGTCK
ncbi:MAG: hypothetical protein ACT4ON_13470 [Bacteroidota bacterium]